MYDKPMIFYPLTLLMEAGIKDVLVITTPRDNESFRLLLADGSQWGMNISYTLQHKPVGLADAFLVGEPFCRGADKVCLILGDNLFHGTDLGIWLLESLGDAGACIFLARVQDPSQYGVASFQGYSNKLHDLVEKPKDRTSPGWAITGLYVYDSPEVCELAKSLKPSERGELEITDLNRLYLKQNRLNYKMLGRGDVWLDTGTFQNLLQASSYVQTIQDRQSRAVGCPDVIAHWNGWIDDEQLDANCEKYGLKGYGQSVMTWAKG